MQIPSFLIKEAEALEKLESHAAPHPWYEQT
jgi:hypothetical protein